ncbi:hypothetical protein PT165_03135 [Erysipelothrix rhusiopathiae]|nr:hypothetical protein [Allofustis seminis]MDE8290143.1 hypothetical protein [Erysipelothrix rhusiopathiae]MDY0389170.1 hypothetical protein [Methanolobus sp.]OCN04748.1 hypothetical protein A4S06_10665 [Erysipelotrichaceae bacterium MTC7]
MSDIEEEIASKKDCLNYITKNHTLPEEKFTKANILSFIVEFIFKNGKEVVQMAKRNTKQTSKRVASKASKILNDGRYSKKSKSVAGSALSQTRPSKKK